MHVLMLQLLEETQKLEQGAAKMVSTYVFGLVRIPGSLKLDLRAVLAEKVYVMGRVIPMATQKLEQEVAEMALTHVVRRLLFLAKQP